MQPLHPWQVVSITEGSRFTEPGQPVRTRVVKYMVGKHGPFTLEIDQAEFTGELLERRLNEEAAHILRVVPPGG